MLRGLKISTTSIVTRKTTWSANRAMSSLSSTYNKETSVKKKRQTFTASFRASTM